MAGNARPDVARQDDWESHWARYDAGAARNPAQRWRHRLLLQALAPAGSPAPTRLLDVGSGQGDFAALARRAWPATDILGLELSQTGCRLAAAKVPDAAFHAVDLLAGAFPNPDRAGRATHAVCSEVLEHVDDPAALLRAAAAWMAPGCRLVVTVPGGPMSAFDRHIGHRRHFTPAGLAALLDTAGFAVDRADGAGFPFFNLYRLVVIARGRRLVADVASGGDAPVSPLAGLVMDLFGRLFALNPSTGRLGWQITAVARKR